MEIRAIQQALFNTWVAIAPDIGDEPVHRDEIIEIVLEANRLEQFGDLQENDIREFRALNYAAQKAVARGAFGFEYYAG